MEMIIKDINTKEILLEKRYQTLCSETANLDKCKTIRIHNDIVENKVTEYYNQNSILIFGMMNIKKDISIEMYTDEPFYEMHFCINGRSAFNSTYNNVKFNKNQHNLYLQKELQGTFKQNENSNEYMEVLFPQDHVDSLINQYEGLIPPINKTNNQLFQNNALVNVEIKAVLTEIYNTNRTGVMKQLYLDVKSKELLLLQFEQYIRLNSNKDLTKISLSDKQKLAEAKEHIEQNYQAPLSLSELALEVGLNDYKLKKGFKEVYNTTVFGYVYQLRMEYAHKLLRNTTIPIKEIAHYCGYEHVQHFTSAFKRMYQTTPAKYREA
ncbi:AraC family transcriptional regulator [Myroides odoratimimus]|uniref:AraC family transcriptional regulator n=1 Tax=Myroides odoratimimus TaxID=76832 RepID=UPI001CE1EB94|nr:AraC family transcriptional regulator [Myroides odoratimimus]MCA4791900.1 helix-turn-helix transcriptional regulator [Myroides odoratimimus]MCA4807719.1 helix-turn-helix transcriptional regulator [Myroides odoratimimus]MCA4819161.1 helix-turn-helix transcriptional regulator [Myroides odoratimimus]MDM1095751.1 helix-turn-helix transcriptional regulator [Myroides odoratimimus]MDM1326844.1 helix-turn-helix transcriptional regulator [Myroides odoratimimus]